MLHYCQWVIKIYVLLFDTIYVDSNNFAVWTFAVGLSCLYIFVNFMELCLLRNENEMIFFHC